MNKNIFNKKAADEIVARTQALTKDRKPAWGSMTVTEMLHHCNTINKMNMEGGPDGRKSTLKQHVLRILVLYITKHIPKNVKPLPGSSHKKLTIPEDQFEEEKAKFIKTIREFSENKRPIQVTHPVFGKLNRREWGVFTWLHMDHHLRQFGV